MGILWQDVGPHAIAMLRSAGVRVTPGLDLREFDTIARRFDFRFGEDHKAMLAAGLPLGEYWVDWRSSSETDLRARLEEPIRGILAHVDPPGGFWMPDWGPEPDSLSVAQRVAEAYVRNWPRLIPLYSHRYTPAAPSPSGAPVLSASGTDIVYYGSDLIDYIQAEFAVDPHGQPTADRSAVYSEQVSPRTILPWANLDNC